MYVYIRHIYTYSTTVRDDILHCDPAIGSLQKAIFYIIISISIIITTIHIRRA